MSKVGPYGAQHHGVTLVRGLLEMGHQVEAACPSSGWFPDEVRRIPAPVHALEMQRVGDLARLVHIIRHTKPDVVHSHCRRADYLSLIAARLSRVPVVATQHTPRYSVRLKYQDAVIAVSRRVKRALVNGGVKAEKVHVVHNGIEWERFAAPQGGAVEALRGTWSLAENDFVVALVGGLINQKGQDVLIKAAAVARDRGCPMKILIVGQAFESDYVGYLHRLTDEAGLAESVFFTGHRTDIPNILALSNVVALPSKNEAFGLSLLEGMAAGLPVVGTTGEGAEDIITEGEDGFLVPYGDCDRLAEVLVHLKDNPSLAREIGRRGGHRVANDFSCEGMVRNVVDVYEITHASAI